MARSRCTSFRRLSPSSPCVCKFLIAAPANEQAKKKIGEFKKRKGDKRSRLFERPSFLLASIRSHTTRPPPLTFDEGLCDRKVTAARNKGQIEGVVKRSGSLRRQGQETIIWCGEENFVFFFAFIGLCCCLSHVAFELVLMNKCKVSGCVCRDFRKLQ